MLGIKAETTIEPALKEPVVLTEAPDVPGGLRSVPIHFCLAVGGADTEDDPVALSLTLGAPMLVAPDSEASSGQYIWVPEVMGTHWTPSQGGYAEFVFEVPAAAQYLFWGRVLSSHGGNELFFLSMDGGLSLLWDTQVSKNWTWDRVNNREVADPVYFDLSPGVISSSSNRERMVRSLINSSLQMI